LIIVPAAYGGCDEWGWNPEADHQPVNDVAEAAFWRYGARRFVVRVTPDLIEQALPSEGYGPSFDRDKLREALSSLLATNREEHPDRLLTALLGMSQLAQQLLELLMSLQDYKRRLERSFDVYGYDEEERPNGVVLVAPFGLKRVRDAEDACAPTTEVNELGSTPGYAHNRSTSTPATSSNGRTPSSEAPGCARLRQTMCRWRLICMMRARSIPGCKRISPVAIRSGGMRGGC
jgi:CRISPR-associated endonuclease/helicase Cas3